jgi:hypothetical protein
VRSRRTAFSALVFVAVRATAAGRTPCFANAEEESSFADARPSGYVDPMHFRGDLLSRRYRKPVHRAVERVLASEPLRGPCGFGLINNGSADPSPDYDVFELRTPPGRDEPFVFLRALVRCGAARGESLHLDLDADYPKGATDMFWGRWFVSPSGATLNRWLDAGRDSAEVILAPDLNGDGVDELVTVEPAARGSRVVLGAWAFVDDSPLPKRVWQSKPIAVRSEYRYEPADLFVRNTQDGTTELRVCTALRSWRETKRFLIEKSTATWRDWRSVGPACGTPAEIHRDSDGAWPLKCVTTTTPHTSGDSTDAASDGGGAR